MVVPVLAARWIPRRCPMHPREDPHLRYPDHCGFQRHSDRPFSTCETPGPRSFHRSPTALRHGRAFPFRPRPSRRSEPAISALYPAVRRSRSNRLPFWSQRCCLLACTIPARCLPCQAWQPDRTNHSITTFYVFSCKSGIAQHGRRDRISGFTPSCPANPHSCMARKTSLLPLSVAPGPHPGHPFIDSLSGSLLIGVESGGIVLIVPRRIRVHPDPGSNNVDAGIAAPYSRPWPPDETGDAPRRSAEQGWSARCFPRSHPRGGGADWNFGIPTVPGSPCIPSTAPLRCFHHANRHPFSPHRGGAGYSASAANRIRGVYRTDPAVRHLRASRHLGNRTPSLQPELPGEDSQIGSRTGSGSG